MKLERHPGIKAGAMLREPEPAPAFDVAAHQLREQLEPMSVFKQVWATRFDGQVEEAFKNRHHPTVAPTLWKQVMAFAQAAWIDEEGKIRVKMEAPHMKAGLELPERSHL